MSGSCIATLSPPRPRAVPDDLAYPRLSRVGQYTPEQQRDILEMSYAVFLSTIHRLTPLQERGLEIFVRTLKDAGDEFPLTLLKEKFADLRIIPNPNPERVMDDVVDAMGYVARGTQDLFEIIVKIDGKLTDSARKKLLKALVKQSTTDDFISNLGTLYSISDAVDNPRAFGLAEKTYAIMTEVTDDIVPRRVDALFYDVADIADINRIGTATTRNPNAIPFDPSLVISTLEVKWLKPTTNLTSNIGQLSEDIIRSVFRGKNMSDIRWALPNDYPPEKIDTFVELARSRIETILASPKLSHLSDAQKVTAQGDVMTQLDDEVFQYIDRLRTFDIYDIQTP